MAYDLTVLDPTEFEALASDLLSKSWGSRLESFKEGKDGGIDLRHSRIPENEPTTIVQCKRYATNALARLVRKCKEELPKLAKLQPTRYVLATTVPLSPDNKDKLVATLSPWCRSPADIYGPDELNGLLRQFPEVERAHFKLWISSTTVLERVLHAGVFSLTDATLEEARHQLSRLVVHEGLSRALDLLQAQHHVLIVGNPGIGKTTLAQMLVCHYLTQGFEPVWVTSDIRDAWNLIRGHDAKGQRLVVVYDDFLGRLRFESPRFEKNEDVSLLTLVEKVARSSNLRLILTTREYILEDAKRMHGSFDERAHALLTCVLSLEDYSRARRAQMVFNHLYFSDLPQLRIKRFVKTKAYRFVVDHRHFNPRIVESISKYANSRARSDKEFIAFVQEEFDNPAKLWQHPFRYEIGELAREILLVLWTFGGPAEVGDLSKAVARVATVASGPEYKHQFDAALKQIEGNFVATNRYDMYAGKGARVHVIAFQNPSIEEFIERQIIQDPSWLEVLCRAVSSLAQARQILHHISDHSTQCLSAEFWSFMRESGASFERVQTGRPQRMLFGSSEKPLTLWSRTRPTAAQGVLTRLEIDAKAGSDDHKSMVIKEGVLTTSGWEEIIRPLDGNMSVATHTLALQRWIVHSSKWTTEEKTNSENCLREAILRVILSEDIWFAACDSVVELCHAITIVNSCVGDDLRQALVGAATATAHGVLQNADEPDILRSEAESLTEVSKLLSCSASPLIEELLSTAQSLEEKIEENEDDDVDRIPEAEKLDQEFDLDGLFQGLLDR